MAASIFCAAVFQRPAAEAAAATSNLGGINQARLRQHLIRPLQVFGEPRCLSLPKTAHFSRTTSVIVHCCSYPVSETMKLARKQFAQEVSFRKRDDSISLAKAAFLIAAEDEAFISSNNEKDLMAAHKEGRIPSSPKPLPLDATNILLQGITISSWLAKLDKLSDDVKASSGNSGEYSLQILRSLLTSSKAPSLSTQPTSFYLHHTLMLGSGSAIMLCIVYIEVCRRLGVGVQISEEIYGPLFNEMKMVFEASNCHTSNRSILGSLLKNLKRVYWRKAGRGWKLTTPLHPLTTTLTPNTSSPSPHHHRHHHHHHHHHPNHHENMLVRPHDLRLAVAASERLMLLHPQEWEMRRDHGLLLYYARRYGEAVQELSICMAVAPVQQVQVLEPFVEKLHLLRVESSWAMSASIY